MYQQATNNNDKYGFKNVGSEIIDIGNNYAILDNIMIKEL
jgi:hypothetical protein